MYTQTITSGCPGGGIGRGRGEKIYFIKNIFLDFPGSAEVKTLCSQCEGHGLYFWKRNKDATCHAAWQKKLKKKMYIFKNQNLMSFCLRICFMYFPNKNVFGGNSLVVQWFGLWAFTAEGPGSIPGRGTKILKAMQYGGKKKNRYLYM